MVLHWMDLVTSDISGWLINIGVKLVDLDQEPFDMIHVFDEKDFKPHAVRMSHLMLDPDSFIVSVAG